MRAAHLCYVVFTLLLVAEWQWSPCSSIKIQPNYNGLSESNAIPVRFYEKRFERDALRRTAAASPAFDLATKSRSSGMPSKARERLLLETSSSEVHALMAFKAGITSDPLDVLRSWNGTNSDACSWKGVQCSPNSNHVAAIELPDLQLEGSVSALLGELSFLEHLDISNNNFSGPVPSSLANCSNLLYLNISSNQMTEGIPSQLGQLRVLLTLDLSYNNLTGEIPATLGNCSSLQYLNLGWNSIGGSIPSQLGLLSSMQTLNLESCSISGSMPSALGNCTSLTVLRVGYNNQLGGELPLELGLLIHMEDFDIYNDNFRGNFPKWILNMTAMQSLFLTNNQFDGEIPGDIGLQLSNLSILALAENAFTGKIPPSIVNNTALFGLDVSENQLSGTLPPDIGLLSNMQEFYVYSNSLTGIIPPSLANCSQLVAFMVGGNPFDPQVLPSWIGSFVNLSYTYLAQMNLYGRIPEELGNLSNLWELITFENNLTGTVPASIGNCTSLSYLEFGQNQLSGELPPELGLLPYLTNFQIGDNLYSAGPIPAFIFNLTTLQGLGIESCQFNGRFDSYDFGKLWQLLMLEMGENDFEGPLSQGLANCSYLQTLDIDGNRLSGAIPPWLANLTDLGSVSFNDNQFSGSIAPDLMSCNHFSKLDFSENNLEGTIPEGIGGSSSLQVLSLFSNNLTGDIPNSLGNCTQLITLYLYQNRLTGSIPGTAFAPMASSLAQLDLSQNLLSGPWPSQLSELINLQYLNVSRNNISGSIPPGLGRCVGLEFLDLSFNQFTGPVPQDLGLLQHLMTFNASYNSFEGPIPDSGAFESNLTAASFLGNPDLCGGILGPHRQCPVQAPASPIATPHCKGFNCASVWITVVVVGSLVAVGVMFVGYYCYVRHEISSQKFEETFLIDGRIKFSKADMLAIIAAGEENIIGRGANSIVYKVILPDGKTFAMKTWRKFPGLSKGDLETQGEEQWEVEISSEAHILTKLRHRNIIKLFWVCSLLEVKAILLEYMPNGSLYGQLHENGPCRLTWAERFKIILGVTEGMLYLHHEFPEPIIHRDLNSRNILLDADMEPKVCDFAISKRVAGESGEATASTVCGTLGYFPPEYGTGAKVSTKGDVYSFGVVLLEILTAKDVTEVHGQNETLVGIVEHRFPNPENGAFELLDPALKHEGISDAKSMEQMMLVMRVGLFCTKIEPQSRPSMNDIREMMLQIKDVGKEPMCEKTLDELLTYDVASTSEIPHDKADDDSKSNDES